MMRPNRSRQLPRLVVALGVLVALSSLGPAGATASGTPQPPAADTVEAPVEPAVSRELTATGTADFWVVFEQRADLSAAYRIDDWVARGQYVYDQLTATASEAQAGLVAELTERGVAHDPFHIVNAVLVEHGDRTILELARARPEVEAIVAPPRYAAPEPIEGPDTTATPAAVEWGIADIRANQVWDTFDVRGEGIVIANIDTGVQFDHPALVGQYRGNNGDGTFTHDYNWFDATGTCQGAPCDSDRHGTHTMGTMVGDDGVGNQIGVAPGATWIAANGCCPSNSNQTLLAAAEWMLAPTDLANQNPDASRRPHIVNNSWGSEVPSTDPFLEDVLLAWDASGIFGMWSNGNNGELGCQSSGSPGSRIINYSAGAYDVNGTIASFSSRGPGQDGEVKPNLAAPGVDVRSSVPGGGYLNADGTSMAAPHVSGAIALVWSAAPALAGNPAATKELLDGTARDVDDTSCGGTADDNNVYGEGRLDAFAVVDQAPRGPAGVLTGTVTETSSGAGLGGVTITATGDHTLRTTTRADGSYRLRLPVGTYQVAADAPGYFAEPVPGVEIRQDQTTTRNFALEPVPAMTVSADELTSWQRPDQTVSKPLTIGNRGRADLAWQVDPDGSDCGSAGTPPWVRLVPAAGSPAPGTDQPVDVVFDAAGLADGELSGSICLAGNDPKRPAAEVSVTLVVDQLPPQRWVQRDKVTPAAAPDRLHGFGWRVDVDGDTAVVLACGGTLSDPGGAAYVYTRTAAGVWREQAALTPSAPAATCVRTGGSGIPGALAVDGDTVLLGLPIGTGGEPTTGTVTVFTRSGDQWSEQTQLTGAGYGLAVAVEGDTLITTASPDNGSTITHHVYHRDGATWSRQAELTLPDGAAARLVPDIDIAVAGDVAVVNAVRFADTPAGAWRAAVFTRAGADWSFEAELAPSDAAAGRDFARHGVDLDGDTVVVTAGRPDGGEPAAGNAAYVFTRAADGWHQQARLEPEPSGDPAAGGPWRAVAVDGDWIAIGEPGFGVHAWNRVGDGWRQHATLVPSGQVPGGEVGDRFGQAVSLDGDALVTATLPATGNGQGYVFDTGDPAPTVGMAPRTADFGAVPVGSVSEVRTVTIENQGSAALELGTLAPTGADPADFAVTDDDCSGRAIAPGSACTFDVGFTPGRQSLGERSAQIDVPSNASTAPDRVTLTGEGLPAPPAVDVLPRRLVIAAPQGSRLTEPLVIANRGTTDLEWSVFPDPASAGTLELRPVREATTVPTPPVDSGRFQRDRLTTGPAAAAGSTPAPPAGAPAPTSSTPGTLTVSHSRSMDVLPHNTVGCVHPDLTTAGTRFLRTFTLADFGVGASLAVTEVTFGVEQLSVPAEVQVNVYRLVGELRYANLDRLGTGTVSLQPQSESLVTVPVSPDAVAPAGATVVVEVVAPDLAGVGTFLAGSNQDGESAPSYLAAPACGVAEPTPYSRLGVEDPHPVQLVMTMSGRVDCGESWLSVDPTSGTIGGDGSQVAEVSIDTAGLPVGEHSTSVCLATNDPRRPLVSVPVVLDVGEAPPVTFDSLRDRVADFQSEGVVTRPGAPRLLRAVDQAERLHDLGREARAIRALERFQEIAGDPRYVTDPAAREVLVADAERLTAQLRQEAAAPDPGSSGYR